MSIEKKWLIKSDNKIIGPYTVEHVEQLLLKRQVSLIDEIRDMHQRWLYIREVPELKEMTEQIRIELDKKSEQTRTLQSLSKTNTGTFSQTLTAETQTAVDFISHTNPAFTDVDVQAQDVQYTETETQAKEAEPKKKNHHFVFSHDIKIKKEIKINKNKIVYISLAAVLLLSISMASFSFYKKVNQEKNEKMQITKVRRLVLIGADAKAAESYQKLAEHLQNKILPDILTLFPKLDAEGVINPDLALQKVQKLPNLTAVQKSEIELIQFNKSLQLGKLKEAKGFLISAKDLDPDSDVIHENAAILSFLENQYKESANQFLELFNKLNKGRFLYGYVQNHFKEPQITDLELLDKIERYLSTRVEYKKELTLIQTILSARTANLTMANSFAADFANTPIQLTNKFKLPGLVPVSIYKIERMLPYLEKIKSQLSSKSVAYIDIFMNLEKKDAYTAQKLFNQTQALFSNVEKLNMQIAIYSALNKTEEIFALEKTSAPENLNTASHIALLLQKKESKVQDIESHILKLKNEKNILAIWAELLEIQDEDLSQTKIFFQLNSLYAEDFIPYIELKARLE